MERRRVQSVLGARESAVRLSFSRGCVLFFLRVRAPTFLLFFSLRTTDTKPPCGELSPHLPFRPRKSDDKEVASEGLFLHRSLHPLAPPFFVTPSPAPLNIAAPYELCF